MKKAFKITYSSNIEIIFITKETEQTIWYHYYIKNIHNQVFKYSRQERKRLVKIFYFFQEAKDYVILQQASLIEDYLTRIDRAKKTIKDIENMIEPPVMEIIP